MDDEPQERRAEDAAPVVEPVVEERSIGQSIVSGIARVFIALLAMVVSLGVLATIASTNATLSLVVGVAFVVFLFWARTRGDPTPYLGAVAVGVSIAVVLLGSCLALLRAFKNV